MNSQMITFEILKLVLTVIALLFTAVQIICLISEIKSNQKWNAKNVAFAYCTKYMDVIKNIDYIDLSKMSQKEITDYFDVKTKTGKQQRQQVTYVMQYFERLSIGILCDYFDEEIVRRTLDYVFRKTYKQLEPFILLRRYETGNNVFSHYERVATEWENHPMKYPYRITPSNRKKKYKK